MALTHNKISVKNIIAKVYQDLRLKDETDIGSIIEWCAEILGKIGAYSQLEVRTDVPIEIRNYKAEIPCDLVYLDEVGYKGYQLDKSPSDRLPKKTTPPYYTTPRAVNQYKIENINFAFGQSYRFPSGDSFIMENGWFKTTFKEGKLKITYRSTGLDDEGFPLVPDDESYRDACFWYCTAKLMYIKAIEEDRYKWFYQDAETKWRYYVTQAGANAIMPDQFTLENIKRNYIRMIPKLNDYRNFYQNLNNING